MASCVEHPSRYIPPRRNTRCPWRPEWVDAICQAPISIHSADGGTLDVRGIQNGSTALKIANGRRVVSEERGNCIETRSVENPSRYIPPRRNTRCLLRPEQFISVPTCKRSSSGFWGTRKLYRDALCRGPISIHSARAEHSMSAESRTIYSGSNLQTVVEWFLGGGEFVSRRGLVWGCLSKLHFLIIVSS